MKLRLPQYSDADWMYEAYKDWPKGRPNVDLLLRRWIERGDPKCLVGEMDVPVGLITYRQQFFGVWIHNVVVRPDYRGTGFATNMLRLLKDQLVSEGAVVAGYKPLPGSPYDGKYPDNLFTWDMDV